MKQKIERMKSKVKPGGYRTIAVTLCFIVLLTAIGACGLFSAVIAGNASHSGADAKAGKQLGAINAAKDEAEADIIDLGDELDDALVLNSKGDVDLAATGDDTVTISGKFDGSTWQQNLSMSKKNGNYFYSVSSLKNGADFRFGINGTQYACSSAENGSGQRNITEYGDGESKAHTVEQGNHTLIWTGSTGAATIWLKGDYKKAWVTSGTTTSTTYTITCATGLTGGSVSSNKASATDGETVTITAAPSDGYTCTGVTYTPTGGTATPATHSAGNNYTFVMPNKNVSVTATFTLKSHIASLANDRSQFKVVGLPQTVGYGEAVTFTVTAVEGYKITNVTTTPSVAVTKNGNNYSFTMPDSDVSVRVHYASTATPLTVYFKSATGYVYSPYITVNGGTEVAMTKDDSKPLTKPKAHNDDPYSDTGSLNYYWYKAEISNVDTTVPVEFEIRGIDTYMDAVGTFTVGSENTIWLACDNLMEGKTLVDVTGLAESARNFYDTPLNMIDD